MSLNSRLGLLSVSLLLLIVVVFNDWTLFLNNIKSVHAQQTLFPLATAHLSELYGIRSDVVFEENEQFIHGSSSTDHNLSLATIAFALDNDYEQLGELTTYSLDECRTRPACRILAGKAYVRLGQDLLATEIWSGNEVLWSRLIGRTAVTPRTADEFQFLERYYGILHDISPEQAAPFYMLGSIYRSRGGWQQSVPFYEQAVTIEPDNARYLCALGQSLVFTLHDVERGLELCNTARRLSPTDMWVQQGAAHTFAMAGKCDVSARIYEQLVTDFTQRVEPALWLKAFREGKTGKCDARGKQ